MQSHSAGSSPPISKETSSLWLTSNASRLGQPSVYFPTGNEQLLLDTALALMLTDIFSYCVSAFPTPNLKWFLNCLIARNKPRSSPYWVYRFTQVGRPLPEPLSEAERSFEYGSTSLAPEGSGGYAISRNAWYKWWVSNFPLAPCSLSPAAYLYQPESETL